MSFARWSARRVATICFSWVIGFPPLALAALFTRAALFSRPSANSIEGTGSLTNIFEYPSPTATLLSILWLGPPLLVVGIWLLVRERGDDSGPPRPTEG
jgi:hypothetical protein